MSEVSTTGLDLAKEAFQEHGADAAGAVVFEASAGLLSCNFLQLKRRAGLRWKPARLRIVRAASFPASVMKFCLFRHRM